MRLLVSVRMPEEVDAALAGGADIIDAKEPAHGSLGSVTPQMLARIAGRVPSDVPLSIALGDATDSDHLRRLVAGAGSPDSRAETFVKVGFKGVPAGVLIPMIRAGLEAADVGVVLVPVAYADHESAGSPSADQVLAAAKAARARALLVDTYLKDGRSLLDWIDLPGLVRMGAEARGAGMLFALAGSLHGQQLESLVGDSRCGRGARRGLPGRARRCGGRHPRPRSSGPTLHLIASPRPRNEHLLTASRLAERED